MDITYWTPEARIAHRHNNNCRAICELSSKQFYPISIQDLMNKIISDKGIDVYIKLIQREKERRAADIWAKENNND